MLGEVRNLSKKHNDEYPVLAVIMFNPSHAHLIEVLQNNTYVEALHEVTGDQMAVFWASRPEGKVEWPSAPSGADCFMVFVYKEPSCNKELYELFDIKDGQSLPLLVTFSFDEIGRLYFSKTPLNDEGSEESYNRLKNILKEKSGLIKGLSQELKEDKQKMFKELDLFDSANEAIGLLNKIVSCLGRSRSALGV